MLSNKHTAFLFSDISATTTEKHCTIMKIICLQLGKNIALSRQLQILTIKLMEVFQLWCIRNQIVEVSF